MTGPTPDQQRNIEMVIERFDKDWFVDTNTKEILRKPLHGWRSLLNFIWKRRHTVFALYWWVRRNWATEKLVIYSYPIQSDNMPIKGFPVKCELQGGWTIPKTDLKYLTHGPLASEGLPDILVPTSQGWRSAFELFRQFAPVVTVVSGLVTIGTKWQDVSDFFRWIANAL